MNGTSRAGSTLRGLGSLLAVLAILVIPPVFLVVAVGWPLPTTLPSSDDIERALRFGPDASLIVGVLAVVAWLAWAQVALALIVEIIAALRGRARVHLPVLPGTQALAGRLAAGLMLLTLVHPTTSLAAPANDPFLVADIDDIYHPPDLQLAQPTIDLRATATELEAVPAAVGPTVTVERHDTYWAIAERTLGDGTRWRQIHELNVGRTMIDGHTLGAPSEPLRAGWLLELPADANAPTDPSTVTTSRQVVVEPGDHLWAIAEEALAGRLDHAPTDHEVAPYWQQVIEANRPVLVDPANPSLIYPGQVITLPGDDSEPSVSTVDETSAPPAEPTVDEASAPPGEATVDESSAPADAVPAPPDEPSVVSVEPAAPPSEGEQPLDPVAAPAETEPTALGSTSAQTAGTGDRRGALAIGGMASAALAVGVTRAVRARRRRYLRANPGRLHAGTPARDQSVHRAAVANSDAEPVGDLRAALGALADELAANAGTARPRIIQHSPNHLDIYLAQPDDPPDGWSAQAEGTVWTLDPSAPRSPSRTCASPLLVTLGQPDEDGQLYLDLEADGLIALVGDPDAARGLARSILTELSLGPLTDTVQILVVGDLVDVAATTLDHVSLVDTWDEATASLTQWVEGSHAALEANEWPNTFVARGHDEFHDALSPLLVIAAKRPPSDVAELISNCRPAAVALVVADEVPNAQIAIDCQPDLLTVVDLGLSCAPQDLDDDTFASIVRILVAAEEPDEDDLDDGDGPDRDDEASSRTTSVPSISEPDPLVLVEPDYEVLVRVLGEIRVEGPTEPLTPKLTAALSYVALHRSVSVETLEEACWPHLGTSGRQRVRDAMSEIRRIVGSQHLPPATNGHYEIRPSVITDTDLFDLRVAHAAKLPPEEAVELYRSALDLVTGKVFTYPSRASSAYAWIDAENLVSQWEVKIAGVAQQCAESYLELGAPQDAVEVGQRALDALPLHTQITECLMRSHDVAGDTRAVDTVYRAHVEALSQADGLEPDDSTSQLHQELMAVQRRSAR